MSAADGGSGAGGTGKQSVAVRVGGEELQIRSEHPPEYTRAVADYFDEALSRIRAMAPSIDGHKAAILAGLAVTDELFRARRADTDVAARISAMADEIARLLPPVKRGSRASGNS
jgi:cell division protein ZapA (FtsZ GTPase activity inhibitor)